MKWSSDPAPHPSNAYVSGSTIALHGSSSTAGQAPCVHLFPFPHITWQPIALSTERVTYKRSTAQQAACIEPRPRHVGTPTRCPICPRGLPKTRNHRLSCVRKPPDSPRMALEPFNLLLTCAAMSIKSTRLGSALTMPAIPRWPAEMARSEAVLPLLSLLNLAAPWFSSRSTHPSLPNLAA